MVHYITGVLICLPLCFICCCVAAAGAGYKGLYEHEGDYEVIVPRKVTENGDFISHFIPHSFRRSDRKSAKKLHYVVPFGGAHHHVELHPNHKLLGPGAVIERHDKKKLAERDVRLINNTSCHYTGSIRGDDSSRVALSTCNGLSGYIRTKRSYFLIQPARDHHHFGGGQHPHLVHSTDKKSILEPSLGTKGFAPTCTTTTGKKLRRRKRAPPTTEDSTSKCVHTSEFHIETLLVLDHSMLRYHKDIDVENYVLSVFNMAHDLYHDQSLGTNINLAIVRLIRLEDEDHEMNMAVNKDAAKTLEYFRKWQNWVNPAEDTHPNHHDVAVLITRVDICENDNSCGVLGASRLGGMCDRHNQAALCEDNGLRLGFIIAHEIGHTLALLHDTPDESGCNATLPGNLTTVMSPRISINTAEWSRCSVKILQIFMESGFGTCLYDPPTEHSFVPVDVLPGVMYDGNYQCKEMFGPNAALCMTGIDCQNLICYIEDKGCIETHQSLAPGTACGEKKWCYYGRCVQVGERPDAVEGGWGPWSDWSQCSRTCGSGVSVQTRHCDSPMPARGGKYCSGDHKQYKICSTEPCEPNQPSFRDIQCAEFNSWIYPEDNKVHQWKGYTLHDENPCVLFCINDLGDIASLRPRVLDGTVCNQPSRGICINGLCKEIPCDLDLASNAVEDVCGVCKGDGTSCKLVDGEVNVFCCSHIKEDQILIVPEKSVNIKIEEMVPTESRIQIRSKDGETVFVIGNVLGTFNVPGSSAWIGNVRAKQEAISIPGPISEAISIWVVVMENVTVRYTFGVPDKNKRTPKFSWDFLTWTRCTAECGPGTQEAIPACVEKYSGQVDEMYCANLKKLKPQIRTCEIAPCVNRWFIGDWLPCSKCPKGTRTRIVKCVKPTGEGEGGVEFMTDGECVGPKPKTSEPCTCVEPIKNPSPKKRAIRNMTGSVEQQEDFMTESTLWGHSTGKITSTTNASEICQKIANQLDKTIIDRDDVDNLVLTIHTEKEDGKLPEGIPRKNTGQKKLGQKKTGQKHTGRKNTGQKNTEQDNTGQKNTEQENEEEECEDVDQPKISLQGKEAMKFLSSMQKNFDNNKTRI